MQWVRIDIGWSSLQESARGQFSPWYVKLVDKCVSMANARGIKVLGMLFRTPGWANGGQDVYVPPTDVSDYAWIANWAAARYRGKVQAWEIWNEPDPAQEFWQGSGQYVQLLKAAYPAIKQAIRTRSSSSAGRRRTTTGSSPRPTQLARRARST